MANTGNAITPGKGTPYWMLENYYQPSEQPTEPVEPTIEPEISEGPIEPVEPAIEPEIEEKKEVEDPEIEDPEIEEPEESTENTDENQELVQGTNDKKETKVE